MGALFGLDCPSCSHDTVQAYRLRLRLMRTTLCLGCGNTGLVKRKLNLVTQSAEAKWYGCPRCLAEWKADWEQERGDMIFRTHQRDAALSHMAALGCENPQVNKPVIVEKHRTIPVGYSARFLWLVESTMPRTAVYFVMRPTAGESVEPEKAFQCTFRPDMSAAERQHAAQFELTREQIREMLKVHDGFTIQSYSGIRCQHCGVRLPMKQFNLLSCREVLLGD